MTYKQLSWRSWAVFIAYVVLLMYFNVIDVYHQHFFAHGFTVIVYHLMRLLFIFSLMWLFYSVGVWALYYFDPHKPPGLPLQTFILPFFAGAGIWQIGLLGVGLLGLYQRPLMIILTMLIFLGSLPKLDQWIKSRSHARNDWYLPGILLVVIAASMFLMVKGLYPAGGHDYYNHYFHFYRKVTETGSILPNEIWYHFYYCKGEGIFFLSILLTDLLAPQLATTALIFASAAMVFSILKQRTCLRLLPWIGAALYLTFLIYTPGPKANFIEGGWADLEKPHEPAAVFMFAIIWLTLGFGKIKKWHAGGITLLLTVSGLVITSPTMAVFAVGFLGLIFIYYFFQKNTTALQWISAAIGIAIFWLMLFWGINYIYTGLPDDQGLFLFFPIINFETLKQWGLLFDLLLLHHSKAGLVARQLPLTPEFIFKAFTYLRLDVWGWLFCAGLLLFVISLIWQQSRRVTLAALDRHSLWICACCLVTVIVVCLVVGRDQPISFYRFTSFSYAPMLCVSLLIWSAVLCNSPKNSVRIILLGIVLCYAGDRLLHHYVDHPQRKFRRPIGIVSTHFKMADLMLVLNNAAQFMRGHYSIADAYQNQQGWPGRMPWGGIYPPAYQIWQLLPPRTRIWSFHVHSYCMLPDCHMEGYMSFRLSLHADTVYFGDPQLAKYWLKKEHLNYFFISTQLKLIDPLSLTPLFSPKHIAQYFGIAWTDGENTLLTWKEDARFPIDSAWLSRYNQQVNTSSVLKSFPYDKMRAVMETARRKKRLTSSDLPWGISK